MLICTVQLMVVPMTDKMNSVTFVTLHKSNIKNTETSFQQIVIFGDSVSASIAVILQVSLVMLVLFSNACCI